MEPPAALTRTAFRTVWMAGLVSDAGDWLLLIALPIVVYRMTGSALGTSIAFLAELVPGILIAPVGGQIADRVDRRRLMVAVAVLQAIALLPLLLVGAGRGLAIVYAVIVAQASLRALFDPAKNALLPTLVAPHELISANSLVGLGSACGRLIGGPLGGVLLAAGGLRTVIVADAASFLVAALLIARLAVHCPGPFVRIRPRPPRGQLALPLPSATRIRMILADPRVLAGLLVGFVADIAQGIFLVLFIVFVARRLGGGSSEIGVLRGVQAVGAIGAGLLLAGAGRRVRPAALTAYSALSFAVIELMIWNGPALSTAEVSYVVLFMLAGAPGVALETGLLSYLQSVGTDAERGRIFGAVGLATNAGQAIGMMAAGTLTAPLGLMALLNAQVGLVFVSALLAALLMGRAARARGQRDWGPEPSARYQAPVA
jgi:MFS family permease